MSGSIPWKDPLAENYALIGRLITIWSSLVLSIEDGIGKIERNVPDTAKATPDRKVMQRLDHLIGLIAKHQPDNEDLKPLRTGRAEVIRLKRLRDAVAHGFVLAAAPGPHNAPEISAKNNDEFHACSLVELHEYCRFLASYSVRVAGASSRVAYA